METTLQTMSINNHNLFLKEVNGQMVVTFRDIDEVHERLEGTARKRFNKNKWHFLEGEDYYRLSPSEIRTQNIMCIDKRQTQDIVFLTEFGYLMLVKSLTDKLAWQVQRQLVNGYFKAKNTPVPIQSPAPQLEQSIKHLQLRQEDILDCLSRQAEMLLVHEEQIAELTNDIPNSQIGLTSTPVEIDKKELIRNTINPLAEKLNDITRNNYLTYHKVYVAMNVNWKYRMTRYMNLHKLKNAPNKITLISEDEKLLELFQDAVEKMLQK